MSCGANWCPTTTPVPTSVCCRPAHSQASGARPGPKFATRFAERPAFEVELTGIRTFPVTDVIYLEVGAGATELCEIHAQMNSDSLAFQEPFAYHPHVTLAQDISKQDVADLRKLAERRWREFRGQRSFRAERAVFVQSTISDRWLDLAEYQLGGTPVNL